MLGTYVGDKGSSFHLQQHKQYSGKVHSTSIGRSRTSYIGQLQDKPPPTKYWLQITVTSVGLKSFLFIALRHSLHLVSSLTTSIKLYSWLECNGLKINVDKTQLMVLCGHRKNHQEDQVQVNVVQQCY